MFQTTVTKGNRCAKIVIRHDHGMLIAHLIEPEFIGYIDGDVQNAMEKFYYIFRNNHVIFVNSLKVEKFHRNKGIGSGLMKELEKVDLPYNYILLEAYPTDPIANGQFDTVRRKLREFYAGLGYDPTPGSIHHMKKRREHDLRAEESYTL